MTEIEETERKMKTEVTSLENRLKEMPADMRLFSLTLRSLYAEKSVGTSDETTVKFRKLRDDTRNDAIVYLKGILPLSSRFVACISEYFEYYEALDYNEWCGMLSEIRQETVSYKEQCNTILKMHEDMLVPLKKREDDARILITEFKDLSKEYEKKKEELVASAMSKRIWAVSLVEIPTIGAIAFPLLFAASNSDLAQAVAKEKQGQINQAASKAVSEALIPALGSFIDGLKKAAGFFSAMEQELMSFEVKAEKALNDRKKVHFTLMKSRANGMKSVCQTFCSVIPDVKTDFLAIPTSGTDQNYVDEWLKKQKKTIEENCKIPLLAAKLLASITKTITK